MATNVAFILGLYYIINARKNQYKTRHAADLFLAEYQYSTVICIQQGIYREILTFESPTARFHTTTSAHIAG